MFTLDPVTLLIAIAVFSAVLAGLSFSLARALPAWTQELRRWGISMLCCGLAFAGYGLRGSAPIWLTLLVANLAAMGTACFGLLAHAAFRQYRIPVGAVVGIALAGLSGPALVYIDLAPMRFAVVAMSLAVGMLASWCVVLIIRPHRIYIGSGAWLSCIACAAWAAVLLLRGLFSAFADEAPSMTSGAVPQLTTLLFGGLYAVTGTLGFVLMIAERHRDQALESARRDGLTGLLNRNAFVESAEGKLHTGQAVSLLMVDLDFFKQVNDRFGHAGGDAVLVHAARRLATCCRSSDLVGRYGGEEFCVLLLADERTAAKLAERLVQDARLLPVRLLNSECRYTLSVGYVARPAGEVASPTLAELFESADRALYEAKRRGRDRAVSASDLCDAPMENAAAQAAIAATGQSAT